MTQGAKMQQAEALLKKYSVGSGKAYRASSLTVYGAILGKLELRARENHETLLAISPATIARFLAEQTNANTVKRYACFLDDFYAYFAAEDAIKTSPAHRLRDKYSYPEKVAATTGFVADESEAAFLAALPAPRTWKKARDAALLALSLGTGLKLKEMIHLNLRDVFLDQDVPVVLVHHRHVSRAVPIRKEVLPFLRQWLAMRRLPPLCDLLECFPASTTGGHLAPSTVWRQARKVLEAAGLEDLTHFGTSALRVSYARIEAEEGSALPLLQHRLGHKRETSTLQLLEHAG
jgi:site-specific recombinase XerD